MVVKVDLLDELELEGNTKKYRILYSYYSENGNLAYSSSPVVVLISYPDYGSILSRELESPVQVYIGSNYR